MAKNSTLSPIAVNLTLILASVALSIVLAELAARAFLSLESVHMVKISRAEASSQAAVEGQNNPGETLYIEPPAGRRRRPNLAAKIHNHDFSHRDATVTTNEWGFSGRGIGPKHGRRILFLGDSITLSDYLNDDETFPAFLESRARQLGLDYEAINAEVNGLVLLCRKTVFADSCRPQHGHLGKRFAIALAISKRNVGIESGT